MIRKKKSLPPAKRLWRAVFDAIGPIPALSVAEWAEKYRRLSRESSSEPGQFRCKEYQREPMEAFTADDVAETVVWWAGQLGKSEMINNATGFFMDADPSTILMVQPTVERCEDYSKERIAPMIRDTARLRKLVRDPRSRDSGNTLLSKTYPGGNFVLVGANAPSGLAGRPRRVILKDEVDRFPFSAGTEGDPCALADKRAETFPNAVKVSTSTATVRGMSKIEKLYEQSDQRKWNVRCPKCGGEFVLLWEQMQWPEGKSEEAWLQCPIVTCNAALTDADRISMVRSGRWVETAKFNGVRGYWLNGMNTLFRHHTGYRNRLHEFVSDFIKARDGGTETEKVWINTFKAETYEEKSSALDASEILGRSEEYAPDALPEGALMVVASADVQKMRIEVEFKAYGKDEECWAIKHHILEGDTEKDAVWAELDKSLSEEFEREDGVKLKVLRAFIDMGYRQPRVLTFCAPRIGRGIYPCKGINRVGLIVPPLLPAKPSRNNKARIPHWNVGVTVAKIALHDRIGLPLPGARTMHFPVGQGYDADYFKQFVAEKKFTKFAFGQPYFVFEKENNMVRNEALDLNVYALAAIHSLFPIAWDKLAENLKATAPKIVEVVREPTPEPNRVEEPLKSDAPVAQESPKSSPPIPTPPQVPRPPRMRGGFVQRWKWH